MVKVTRHTRSKRNRLIEELEESSQENSGWALNPKTQAQKQRQRTTGSSTVDRKAAEKVMSHKVKGKKVDLATFNGVQNDIFSRLPSAPDPNREYVPFPLPFASCIMHQMLVYAPHTTTTTTTR